MYETTVQLQTANGAVMKVYGRCRLPIQIGNCDFLQNFVVVENVNNPLILGMDFFKKNDVTINIPNRILTIGSTDVPISTEEKQYSKARLTSDISVQPQSVSVVYLKTDGHLQKQSKDALHISSAQTGVMNNEPGLFLLDTVSHVNDEGTIPAIIINETHKNFRLTTHNVVGEISKVEVDDLQSHHNSMAEINALTANKNKAKKQKPDPKFDTANLKVTNPEISSASIEALKSLIDKFPDVFSKHQYDIGRASKFEASIPLVDDTPICRPMYRIPLALQDDVRDQLQNLLEYNIIEPSTSSFNFSLVTAKKKDKSTRICVDLRPLNKVVKFFSYPMGS